MKVLARVALPILLGALTIVFAGQGPNGGNASEESKLRFAATQHEIIAILVRDGQFANVIPEFQKILDLAMSSENEGLVVEEAWIIVNQLRQSEQFSIAHEVIDRTLGSATQPANQFKLLMLQGKLLKDEGRLSEALEVYRKAQALQR